MTKNMKITWITLGSVLGAGVVATAIAVPVVLLQNNANNLRLNLNTVKYNLESNSRSNLEFELDPNFNNNALTKMYEKFTNLSKEDLQYDFNNILTDFYEVYEFEDRVYEAEIKRVVVNSIAPMNKDTFTRTAQLSVTYKVEKERRDRDETIVVNKEFIIRPSFITNDEIQDLSIFLANGYTQNHNIDLDDLREIFFGEHHADELDDLGIFDQIKRLNSELGSQNGVGGGLMSYTLTLNDLAYAPKRNIDLTTEFKVPSLSINTYAVPNQTVKVDLNKKQLKTITKDQFIALLNGNDLTTKYDNIKPYINNLMSVDKVVEITYNDNPSKKNIKLVIKTQDSDTTQISYKFSIKYKNFK